MVDPEEPKKESFINKITGDERIKKGFGFFWGRRIQFLTGILMLAGIIFSFFYIQIGGLLVGLAFGICFYGEIYTYFLELRDHYAEQGLFKTLMSIGTILYFLIAIPAFIIAAAIGFGAIYLIRLSLRNR